MARGRARIERHGANHSPGGSDPIPGLVGGGGGPRTLLAVWAGTLPSAVGAGLVFRVPYAGDGSALTFTIDRAFARLESSVGGDVTFELEHSAGGDAAFSASTISTLTVASGHFEEEDPGLSYSVDSGDLLRLSYSAVFGSPSFHVELSGGE